MSYIAIADPKSPRVTRLHLQPVLIVAGIAVFDLGCVLWWGHAGLKAHHIVGRSGDPYIYLWFLKWWAWAISHHKSLVLTRLASNPVGNNILWDTGVPVLFIPFSLLHWYFHIPIDTVFNILWAGSWAGTGVVAYWTFYRLTHHVWGSALGHLLVLFSAYENTESLAHLDLMWLGFIFLFLMVGVEWITGHRTTKSFLVWASLLGLLQWLTNEELFAMMWVAIIFALLARPSLKRWRISTTNLRQSGVWRTVIILAGITALVIAPLYWLQTHVAGQPAHDAIRFAGFFGIDFQNLLWLSVNTIWHHAPGAHWSGNRFEDVGFLGILFFVLWISYWIIERPLWSPNERLFATWLTIWWGLVTIIALGPFLRWGGHMVTVLPGVFAAFVPVLKDMVLPRFMSIGIWTVGLGGAFAMARSSRARLSPTILSISLSLLAISWLPAPHPALATHTGDRGAIPNALARLQAPKNPVLLVFPYDNVDNPTNLMWLQAQDHFRYRLAEGYLSPADPLLARFPRLVAAWDHLDAPDSLRKVHANPYPARLWRPAVLRYLQATRPAALILLRHSKTFPRDITWWTDVLGPATGHTTRTVYWAQPLNRLDPPTRKAR